MTTSLNSLYRVTNCCCREIIPTVPWAFAVPVCISLLSITTDWLVLSPEGGHSVQWTSRPLGPRSSLTPLPSFMNDIWFRSSLEKRWAPWCVCVPVWNQEILFQDRRWNSYRLSSNRMRRIIRYIHLSNIDSSAFVKKNKGANHLKLTLIIS